MKVLALVLVAALALALPLTGCKPKAPVSQGDTGGSTGGTSGAGTTGGTPPAAWAYCQLKAGEHVKYTDAGGGKLKIAYAGSWAGQSFSGDATVGATTVAADLVPAFQSNPYAMIAAPSAFCVSPNFPLAMHTTIEAPGSKLEYTLTEATGF